MELETIDRLEKTQIAISEFLGKSIFIRLNNQELILGYKGQDFCFVMINAFRIIIRPMNISFCFANASCDFETIKEIAEICLILSSAEKREELLKIIKENYIAIFV